MASGTGETVKIYVHFDSKLNQRQAGRGYGFEWNQAQKYREEGLTPQQGYERTLKYWDEGKARKIKKNREIQNE